MVMVDTNQEKEEHPLADLIREHLTETKVLMIAVRSQTSENFRELVPPVKLGNLKDPAKIQAKKDEWEADAAQAALDNPISSVTGDFIVKDAEGVVRQGSGAEAFLDTIEDMSGGGMPVVFGMKSKLALKRAAFEMMKKGESVSPLYWDFPALGQGVKLYFDPISRLSSSFREHMEEEAILKFFGLDPEYHDDLGKQIEVTEGLAKVLGAI